MVFLKLLKPIKTSKASHIIVTSVPAKRMRLLSTFFLLGLQREEIADGEVGDIILKVRRSGNELIPLNITLINNTSISSTPPKDYVTVDELVTCIDKCRGTPDGDSCVKRCLGVVG